MWPGVSQKHCFGAAEVSGFPFLPHRAVGGLGEQGLWVGAGQGSKQTAPGQVFPGSVLRSQGETLGKDMGRWWAAASTEDGQPLPVRGERFCELRAVKGRAVRGHVCHLPGSRLSWDLCPSGPTLAGRSGPRAAVSPAAAQSCVGAPGLEPRQVWVPLRPHSPRHRRSGRPRGAGARRVRFPPPLPSRTASLLCSPLFSFLRHSRTEPPPNYPLSSSSLSCPGHGSSRRPSVLRVGRPDLTRRCSPSPVSLASSSPPTPGRLLPGGRDPTRFLLEPQDSLLRREDHPTPPSLQLPLLPDPTGPRRAPCPPPCPLWPPFRRMSRARRETPSQMVRAA